MMATQTHILAQFAGGTVRCELDYDDTIMAVTGIRCVNDRADMARAALSRKSDGLALVQTFLPNRTTTLVVATSPALARVPITVIRRGRIDGIEGDIFWPFTVV